MVGSGSGISKQNLLIACVKKEVGSGAFLPPGSGLRIRDGTMVGSGSGIKHPGFATLTGTKPTNLENWLTIKIHHCFSQICTVEESNFEFEG
jgi:hypothetical protein